MSATTAIKPLEDTAEEDAKAKECLGVEIRYLTSALSGRSLPISQKLGISTATKTKLTTFTHLSHLLCLGLKACPAVAVTGSVEKDQVSVIVFATNSRTDDSAFIPRTLQTVSEPESFNISSFGPRPRAPPPTLFQHAQGCQLGLRLLREQRISGGDLHLWFLAQGTGKIWSRLRSITTKWEVDVLKQLDSSFVPDKLKGTIVLPPILLGRIKAVVPTLITENGALETVVDHTTAAAWTTLLAACLDGIGRALGSPTTSTPITALNIEEIHWWIFLIFYIANSSVMISIFTHSTLSKNLIPRDAQLGVDDDEEDLLEEGIPNGTKFLHHVSTLATWYSAILYFASKSPLTISDNVNMQIVRVAELPKKDQDFRKIDADVRQRVVDRARAAEETVLFPGDTFEDLSVELRSPADSSHTHCEASLMALIVDKDPDLIVPQVVSQWPVGVSKKCCWTCWKLRELLAPTFVMSGTHRIVYGWVPPPGLSVEVLTGLRDALLEAYGDACQTELEMSRRSAQTSPASPNFGTDMTVMFPSSHK